MKWKQVNVQSFIRIIYEDKRQKSFGLIENDDDDDDECKEERGYQTVWPVWQVTKCLLKLAKNDFTRKMKDFDTFTKIA